MLAIWCCSHSPFTHTYTYLICPHWVFGNKDLSSFRALIYLRLVSMSWFSNQPHLLEAQQLRYLGRTSIRGISLDAVGKRQQHTEIQRETEKHEEIKHPWFPFPKCTRPMAVTELPLYSLPEETWLNAGWFRPDGQTDWLCPTLKYQQTFCVCISGATHLCTVTQLRVLPPGAAKPATVHMPHIFILKTVFQTLDLFPAE